ncbi:hypothetical protein EDC01DRAFT_712929 [Geopyxis carbonaria]|nr:hypothetical protein EDC01DRAFT_712929 [Geopyxis carbonaria]
MKPTIPTLTVAAATLLLPLASAQYASYPAGIDPSLKYWPPGTGPPSKRWLRDFTADDALTNTTLLLPHHQALLFSLPPSEKFYWDRLPHAAPQKRTFHPPSALAHGLFARAGRFECAAGTSSCRDIGQESYCCDEGTTCAVIADTGYGTVGCCPAGQKCSGPLTGCGAGKQTCPDALGGGCCSADTECSPMGCRPAGASAAATTTAVNKPTCTSGFYACPTNVAGGCCPSGRLCGVSDCPAPAPTASLGCPAGYNTCASEFSGGCCRAGRGCGVTDCPALDAPITSAAAGATPTQAIQGGAGGLCPTGWNPCAVAAGGGCCPNGYECGIANCPARTLVGGGVTTTLPATEKQPQATFFVNSNDAAGKRRWVEKRVVVVVGVVAGVVARM